MRFLGVRILLIMLLLVAVSPDPSASAAHASSPGTAVSKGAEREHCFAGTAREAGTHLYCTPVTKRVLSAATSRFRKTKVHARRLSACLFLGISRAAEVSHLEFAWGCASLPLTKGPRREKTPQGARSPPLKDHFYLIFYPRA